MTGGPQYRTDQTRNLRRYDRMSIEVFQPPQKKIGNQTLLSVFKILMAMGPGLHLQWHPFAYGTCKVFFLH